MGRAVDQGIYTMARALNADAIYSGGQAQDRLDDEGRRQEVAHKQSKSDALVA